MKRILYVTISLLTVVALMSAGPALAAAKWKIKFGHDHKEDSAHHKAALFMKKKIEEGSNGEIQISIYPTQLLGTGIQMVEMVQAGALELLAVPTSNVQVIHPPLQILGLPFLFENREELHKALDGNFGQSLAEPLLQKNIMGLTYWESGFKQLTCNYPIHKPDDLKGRKFRIMPSPVIREQFKSLGASPVPIDFQELYNALQQGVVDGQENPLMTIVMMKFYEVQKYVSLSNHAWLGYLVMVNKRFYDSLPQKYQTLILETAKESAVMERKMIGAEDQSFLETIKKSNTEVIELDPNQIKEFQQKVQPVYEWFVQNIDGGKKYLDMVKTTP